MNDVSSAIPTAIGWILAIAVFIFVLVVIFRSIRIIPQASSGVVERLGRYHKTLMPGLNLLVPFIDRLRPLIDMREQVVSFPPQPVITEDNLVVSIDTVVYFQVTDARAATYEIANYLGAVEQLTTTTLRNVVGGLNLEEALTSRDNINGQLRVVLDEATGKWGIRVSRVELKAIDPPHSIQDSMEKQMRAERERRATILTAEGSKQSQILEAEGRRQAEILKAEGDKQAAVLRAQGEAEAIQTVFDAIHSGNPDDKLLAYQYLQTLPKIADSASSKLWIIPSEFTEALKGLTGSFAGVMTDAAAKGRGQSTGARGRCRLGRCRTGRSAAGSHPAHPVTHPWFSGVATPRVLAHRGLVTPEAAHSGVVENSFAAVAAAHSAGALYVESDCHLTADGTVVLFHDDDLSRVTGDPRKVADVSARELEELMTGRGGLITLAQALDAFPTREVQPRREGDGCRNRRRHDDRALRRSRADHELLGRASATPPCARRQPRAAVSAPPPPAVVARSPACSRPSRRGRTGSWLALLPASTPCRSRSARAGCGSSRRASSRPPTGTASKCTSGPSTSPTTCSDSSRWASTASSPTGRTSRSPHSPSTTR